MKIIPPRIRITGRGIHITRPRLRIGGRQAGVNVSSQGVSVSGSGDGWSYHSKHGLSINPVSAARSRKGCLGCGASLMLIGLMALSVMGIALAHSR